MVKVLFVCMGNICRSPTAEAVLRHRAERSGMADDLFIDSAGTHAYHIDQAPDERAQNAAARRGYDLSCLRGRQVCANDFREFDYILAMDPENLVLLKKRCPRELAHKLRLYMSYARRHDGDEVPDPYYGGSQGFEQVLDMIEDAAEGFLEQLKTTRGIAGSGLS